MKEDKAPIYSRITVNKERIEISLKRSIEVIYWDTQSKRSVSRTQQEKSLNHYLDQVYSDLQKAIPNYIRRIKLILQKPLKLAFWKKNNNKNQ